ncbi:ABC-2 family transporter protein [Armatimonas sp.]|uniref:ABC transporter permease n=1 Tax=Armatimonas sp. TaxID=1872638 RepID=UPI00286A5A5F|nr:ABC-2 family transporter protein [Armatimonas sp.]
MLRVLLALMRASIRSQMQYKASFVLFSAGNFTAVAVEVIGLWGLFARFGNLPGWTLPQVAVLYAMVHLAFALAEAAGRGFDQFASVVRAGEFDRFLLRPHPTALLLAGQTFELSRIGRFLAGLVALGWGASNAGVHWDALKVATLIGAVLGGALIFYGILVMQAALCFITVESLEIVNALTYGGIMAAELPLTIYPKWIRLLFTYLVPIACMNYLPASVIFGHPGASPWLALLGPVVGVAFLTLALQLWKLGERKYRSTGS